MWSPSPVAGPVQRMQEWCRSCPTVEVMSRRVAGVGLGGTGVVHRKAEPRRRGAAVEAFRGGHGSLPGRPALDVGLELPDGAQRGADEDLGPVADAGGGVDAGSAAGEGLGGAGTGESRRAGG
ncbi:hypothetical protein GCM10020254_04090 [Streptomyces goshikiensis]